MGQMNHNITVNADSWADGGREAALDLFRYGGDGEIKTAAGLFFTFEGKANQFSVTAEGDGFHATYDNVAARGGPTRIDIIGRRLFSPAPGFTNKLLNLDLGHASENKIPYVFRLGQEVISKLVVRGSPHPNANLWLGTGKLAMAMLGQRLIVSNAPQPK